MSVISSSNTPTALLGDTPARNYARKLRLFNAHAAPELQAAVAALQLGPGMRVLDAGCGTGELLEKLRAIVHPSGLAVGFDLAAAHLAMAHNDLKEGAALLQANKLSPPLRTSSFDLIWCANTINHLREPLQGVTTLVELLRPGGRVALMQSSFQPEMFFAWNARLEAKVQDAVRQYYRDQYRLSEHDLTAIRSLVGLIRAAGLRDVWTRTFNIERIAPLGVDDEAYLLDAVFRGTWGERLQPYLAADDYRELVRLCDPASDDYALRRPDFHYLQGFTVVVGRLPPCKAVA